MKRVTLLFLSVFIPLLSSAQSYRQNYRDDRRSDYDASTLSVFSENGEQFFLVLNGVNQNNVPATKLRIEGLPQYGNDIEIIFADRRTQAIRKRINIADPVDGKAVNMTLKIVRERDGFPKLRFHKCTEVEHDYHAPRDEYVMYYGRPGQTTTTTTTTVYEQNTPSGPAPMDQRSFNDAKQSIANAAFEETKLSTAKVVLSNNYVTTDQVIEICNLFSFENNKLAFAERAYSKTIDPRNYYKVGSVFNFDSDKKALNDFISKSRR